MGGRHVGRVDVRQHRHRDGVGGMQMDDSAGALRGSYRAPSEAAIPSSGASPDRRRPSSSSLLRRAGSRKPSEELVGVAASPHRSAAPRCCPRTPQSVRARTGSARSGRSSREVRSHRSCRGSRKARGWHVSLVKSDGVFDPLPGLLHMRVQHIGQALAVPGLEGRDHLLVIGHGAGPLLGTLVADVADPRSRACRMP